MINNREEQLLALSHNGLYLVLLPHVQNDQINQYKHIKIFFQACLCDFFIILTIFRDFYKMLIPVTTALVKCTINHMSMFTNLGPWFDIPKDELAIGRTCCKNGSKWWKCATVNVIRMADQWGRSQFREICCIPQPHCFVSWCCCKCPIWWESHWVHIWCVSSYCVYEAGYKMLIRPTHTVSRSLDNLA